MPDLEYIAQSIPKEPVPDEGIYKITQFLFDIPHNLVPERIQNLPFEVMLYAGTGGYLVTRGLQWFSKNVVDWFIPDFDEKALPVLEKVCKYGLPAVVGVYALSNPEAFANMIYDKSMDNLGIVCGYGGAVIATNQDLKKRSKEKSRQGKLQEKMGFLSRE